MRTFKSHTNEGRVTPSLVKSLGFMLRNKLSQKIKSGKASKDLSQKLDALLDAQGIIGSIGIMNIGMEDGGQSLMSRSIIIRGLINELHEDGIITQSEKELLNDWKAPAPPKQSPKLTLLWSRHQKVDWGKECWVKTLSEQTHRVMTSEVSAWDENVELRNIGLSFIKLSNLI